MGWGWGGGSRGEGAGRESTEEAAAVRLGQTRVGQRRRAKPAGFPAASGTVREGRE